MDESKKKSLIEYDCKDGIATIRFNRPEKLNAFNDDMARQLKATLNRFDLDPGALVAILCGNGRAFSSGADVREWQLRSREDIQRLRSVAAPDVNSYGLMSPSINWKPVVSAVHGYAFGMGVGLALECDLAVAEEGTKFQITETPRGTAGAGKYMVLMSFRGLGSFATDVTLTGRTFTAEEALAAGVIDCVAQRGGYLEKAREFALAIAKNPPLAVRASVMVRRWQIEDNRRAAIRYGSLNKLTLTKDFVESARAFVEKRQPSPPKGR